MQEMINTLPVLITSVVDDLVLSWMEAFLNDRKAQGAAIGTCGFILRS